MNRQKIGQKNDFGFEKSVEFSEDLLGFTELEVKDGDGVVLVLVRKRNDEDF